MMRFVLLVVLVSGLMIGVGIAQADTCTFDATSGDWDVLENWDCVVAGEQVPTAGDRAVIQSGKTCNIDSAAVANKPRGLRRRIHASAGGELRLNLLFGYGLPLMLRLGYGHGLGRDNVQAAYLVLGQSF